MGGQEGSRGYLVQALIALLRSLSNSSWENVTIEPNINSEKVDVQWSSNNHTLATQIKSSQNQIGKSDAERWAADLKRGCIADRYELVLIGPTAQSVVDMGSFNGVDIPCPKNLDIAGLINEAAHLLDKFLVQESMQRPLPEQRELLVHALIAKLSCLSTTGTTLTRQEFGVTLSGWINDVCLFSDGSWERVDFKSQRGIENAVAGKRLGPMDVDACPEFSICKEITTELARCHAYELAGASGCGKSITAWQVARRFDKSGYVVWRPSAFATTPDLLSNLPSGQKLLVVDDAHQYGANFATRLSELSSLDLKVLLISTVENPLLSQVICLSPEKCVEELAKSLFARSEMLLPIVQQYDKSIGNRSGELSLDDRIENARKQSKPWEVFWVIRGGWQSADREIEGIRQFSHALDLLLWIATAQIVSCDTGVPYLSLMKGVQAVGISADAAESALRQLDKFGLILRDESIRTKHFMYARQVLSICFHHSKSKDWSHFAHIVIGCVLGSRWSLRGLTWLLGDPLGYSDAFRFRKAHFQGLLDPLKEYCLAEEDDFSWAAGCMSRLINAFDISSDEILAQRERWHRWVTSGSALAAYFCGQIINTLINKSPRDEKNYTDVLSRPLVEEVDFDRLVHILNVVYLEDFYSIAYLLDRMCFSKPSWALTFLKQLNWERIRTIIAGATSDHAHAIDAMIGSFVRLGSLEHTADLHYIEEVLPFIIRAINENPCLTVQTMHNVFWWCLSYGPRFLMGNQMPGEREKAIAKKIVDGVDPQMISVAMERAVSRELEGLAYTFEFIHKVDQKFATKVAASLSGEAFFASTSNDWRDQTRELQLLIRFFAGGPNLEPASNWVRANKDQIRGPLKPLFVLIAPDVAIEFYQNGKGLMLAADHEMSWPITSGAISRLANTDREQCKRIVNEKFPELLDALYKLSLESEHYIIHFFKVLFELSPELFEQFVDRINLDDSRCIMLVQQLLSTQAKEMVEYCKLVKYGMKISGKLGTISKQLFARLNP